MADRDARAEAMRRHVTGELYRPADVWTNNHRMMAFVAGAEWARTVTAEQVQSVMDYLARMPGAPTWWSDREFRAAAEDVLEAAGFTVEDPS